MLKEAYYRKMIDANDTRMQFEMIYGDVGLIVGLLAPNLVFPKTAQASHPGRQEWKSKVLPIEQFLVQYEETKNEKV